MEKVARYVERTSDVSLEILAPGDSNRAITGHSSL
jgi:hypothetical protein